MYEKLALYIDGAFIEEGRKTEPVVNPATGEVLAHLPHATREDLDRALQAAQKAFEQLEEDLAARALHDPAQSRSARARARRLDRPQHHARPGQAARRSGRRSHGLRRARRMARRRMPAHLRARDPAAPFRRASVRAARAGRRVRRFYAVEFPVQPGDPQDGGGAGRGLHARAERARDRPERRRRARAALSRRRLAAGVSQSRLGRAERDLRVPDQVADRAQSVVHGLDPGRQATRRAGRRSHEARHVGAGRPFAGDRLR